MSSWQEVLLEPARVVFTQIGNLLINILSVILILIAGWLISRFIKGVVVRVLTAVKLDDFSDRFKLTELLEKGGIAYTLSELIGIVCYWLAILVTFIVALTPFNIVTSSLLDRIVSYIPHIISAIFILILGMFFATVLKNIVQAAANNAGISQSKILSKAVEIAIIAFAVLIALEQLKIGVLIAKWTLSVVLVVFGSIGLGLALAFGLGCRDIAGKFVEDFIEKLKSKK